MTGGDAGETEEADAVRRAAALRPDQVDAALVLRAGSMLTASDDACLCLLCGEDALVLSTGSRALSVVNPPLAERLVAERRIAMVQLASAPRALAGRWLFGLASDGRFATRRLPRAVAEAAIGAGPRQPVATREEVGDVI